MPPATAMWLSLINTASSRPKRWLKPPPQRTAYFSSARSPGVVLRVQMMRALVWAMRCTKAEVAVAMPDRWPRKLSAVRSAERIARALPAIVINLVRAAIAMPSRPWGFISIVGSRRRNAASTSGRPETTPGLRATTTARPRVSSGIVAVDVTSPARPRSSSSARFTAASISSGETKASEQKSDIGARYKRSVRGENSYLVWRSVANPCSRARASHALGRPARGRFRLGDQACGSILRGFLQFATDRDAMTASEDRLDPVQSSAVAGATVATWRTPAVVIGMGCLITLIAFGPRSTMGFFLTPLSSANHWGRDVFAFALALQNLLWGIGQPLGGMIADRFGTIRVVCAGALLYATGLVLMS